MMRSLWSGVSGLNAHQTAMDVEANNIANVNTVGFKYSRTNFQNLLSQTIRSATAPQGTLGGKNSLQVGLGVRVSAVETIFKQGSIQNTDKNTDMAINGDGFFVVSGDGGKTYRYTRAGDFTFDANGNFVDPNGYIVQGWLADPDTHKIDTSTGLKPIVIPPGLTTPAKETSKISIKANLNSGNHITEMGGTRATVEPDANLNGLYDVNGNQIQLTPGDQVNLKLVNLNGDTISLNLTYGTSQTDHDHTFTTIKDFIDEINYAITHDSNGVPINTKYDSNLLYLNGNGQLVDQGDRIESVYTANKTLEDILSPLATTAHTSNTIKAIKNSFVGADDVGELFNANGDAFNLSQGQGLSVKIDGLYETRKFVYTPDPITPNASECGGAAGSYQHKSDLHAADSNEGLHWTYTQDGQPAYLSITRDSNFDIKTHNMVKFVVQDSTGTRTDTFTFLYGKDFNTIDQLCCDLNSKLVQDSYHLTLTFDPTTGQFKEVGTAQITQADAYDDSNGTAATGATANFDSLIKQLGDSTSSKPIYKNDIYYFHDIQDLTYLWQRAIDDSNDPTGNQNAVNTSKATVTINKDGKLSITNTSGSSFNISVNGYPSDADNKLFTEAFSSVNGTLASGGSVQSQAMNAAIHTTSIDVFDSLGSKHTITFHFRKVHTSQNPDDPTVWKWYADVPTPGTIDDPKDGGDIKFNPDGSVNSYNPPSIIFSANNGSEPGQAIQLNFGTPGGFDGITSYEAPSSTSGQTQDGYPGGDLQQLTVDQTGTIIGVFTNGRSYSLAQVALAKFVNNEGLMNDGGTLFAASANSGEPIIGTAGTGGRGSIQPSALEMSNVDLSHALTELIVIQRGFQANAKTITTSDQMLNTLLQLKQ